MKLYTATLLLVVAMIWSSGIYGDDSSSIKSSEQIIEEMLGTRGFGVKARAYLDVKFDYNSARLSDQAKAQLDQLGTALKSRELCSFMYELEGHTDSTGPDEYNLSLSQDRASEAFDYLVNSVGLPEERLSKSGHGESRLLNSKDGAAPENRRVEVVEIGEVTDDEHVCGVAG